MKEIFVFMAKYNKITNQTIMDILQGMAAEDIVKDTGSFFKSILGTLEHVLQSDVGYLGRIAGNIPNVADLLANLPEVSHSHESEELQWATLDEFRPVREAVDGILADVMDRLPEDLFPSEITFTDWRGEEQTKFAWYMLLNMFNHETHHRGNVSALLDQMGVENDYSGMNRIDV
jgi:uncharacterized damage-inducible protein DinB